MRVIFSRPPMTAQCGFGNPRPGSCLQVFEGHDACVGTQPFGLDGRSILCAMQVAASGSWEIDAISGSDPP